MRKKKIRSLKRDENYKGERKRKRKRKRKKKRKKKKKRYRETAR